MGENQFSFTFPDKQKKEVEKIAKERSCPVAQVIRDAIYKYIKDHDTQKD